MSTRIDQMKKLVELAEIDLDKSAKTLAAIQESYAKEVDQLDALTSYAQDYSQQPVERSSSMSPIQLQTRHAFGEKLQQALVAQADQVQETMATVERAREAWLEQRGRVKALQAVLEKLKQNLQIKLGKQEQRLLDEISAQKVHLNKISD